MCVVGTLGFQCSLMERKRRSIMAEEENNEQESAGAEVDEELMALANNEPPSVLRPILMIAVILLALWIVADWRAELEFFFSSSEPVELGDALDFASLEDDPSSVIPHNRYVKIRGIPSRRSQSARYRYASLVGSPIFIEQLRPDADMDPIERELTGGDKADVDRVYFEGVGRIVAFSEMPNRYRGLREYYFKRYQEPFCIDVDAASRKAILEQRRDSVVRQWRLEFEEATPEERLEKSLTAEPTAEEVKEVVHSTPVCIDAYLLQVDTKPIDFWWYLLAAVLFLGFMLFNVVMLVRWVRALTR